MLLSLERRRGSSAFRMASAVSNGDERVCGCVVVGGANDAVADGLVRTVAAGVGAGLTGDGAERWCVADDDVTAGSGTEVGWVGVTGGVAAAAGFPGLGGRVLGAPLEAAATLPGGAVPVVAAGLGALAGADGVLAVVGSLDVRLRRVSLLPVISASNSVSISTST